MYPDIGNLSPFQNGYPQYSMDNDFLQTFDGPNGLTDSDLQDMIDPDLMLDDFVPEDATQNQTWDRVGEIPFERRQAEPSGNALASSSAGPIQQAIYSYQHQPVVPQNMSQTQQQAQATVSPSQLFHAPAAGPSKLVAPVPVPSAKTESQLRKPSSSAKSSNPASLKPGSPVKKPSPVRSTSQQSAASKPIVGPSKPIVAVTKSRPSGFEMIKKEYLNGDAKYGWHGRFTGVDATPLDKLMSEVAPQPISLQAKEGASTDEEAFDLSPPKVTLNAIEVAELSQILHKRIPSAYSKAWKQHPGGLRFFRYYLQRTVKALEASPQGSWVQAAYKLLDLLAKVTPSMNEIGYYVLAPPISALVKAKDLQKDLRKYAKEVRQGLIAAQESLEARSSTAQKRASTDLDDESTNKKAKIEATKTGPAAKTTMNGKTVVKVVAKKNNNVDMSAFGLATTAPKPKRVVSTSRPDAVTSLLSGLNPATLNSQANSKTAQDSGSQVMSSKVGKRKPGLRVRFKEGDELEMVQIIENRDDKAYEYAGANTDQLEGEGKHMKEHADLEVQQEWYEPEPLTEVDSISVKDTSTFSPPIDQSTPSESTSGVSTVVEDSPDFVEYELDLSHLMGSGDDHQASMETNAEPNQAFVAPPSDLASLLSQLSKGSNSPATQAGANGATHNGTPPPSAPAPIALDMSVLSKIVSSVNAAKSAPTYNPYATYANLPVQSQYPQTMAPPFSNFPPQHMMSSDSPPQPQGNGWHGAPPSGYQQYNQQGPYNDVRPKKCYDMINKGQCNKPRCRFEH